ncbi:EGF-like repeat and discoidin I-like domain-containing protein 3 [Dendronephthya gigantea]|uniref:EGF-like repeat and discoidin I-like domain-containing protein 3 n=1 Tax=Dendronephthya gigantea TaxID=151771 RepID=UPI0010691F24|nr:EGF-like repeat and discoidin I-like domain-containing protein 3 [Dendronephthya gigantea]
MFLQSSMFWQLQFVFLTASHYVAIHHGSRLTTNVIAEFTEEMDVFCELRCAENRFCVAYNYKKKVDEKELNCQITNTTEHKFDVRHFTKEEQVWTFHEAKVDRSDFAYCREEVNECQNGGTVIWNQERRFSCQCLECYEGHFCEKVTETFNALGMENGDIKDEQITASSELDINHRAANGRLNFTQPDGRRGAWSSKHEDVNQWLQVDFQRSTLVTGISTQGRRDNHQFVRKYTISFSKDGENFQNFSQRGVKKEFQGNTDKNSIVYHRVIPHISARFIRIHPTVWFKHISMRAEFYGCSLV